MCHTLEETLVVVCPDDSLATFEDAFHAVANNSIDASGLRMKWC